MSKLITLVGLPGSGKSTLAKKLSEEYNAKIFSSDEYRKRLFNNENDQEHNTDIFQALYHDAREHIKSDNNAIIDATNINSKKRMQMVKYIGAKENIAIIVATPFEECKRRNNKRSRRVPTEAIKKMLLNFQIPMHAEGFENIRIIYPEDVEFLEPEEVVDSYINMPHDNPYHEYTIGRHMQEAARYLLCAFPDKSYQTLYYATLLHDIGKPIAKTFTDYKGNKTDIAHYYGHECAGAYLSLFMNVPEKLKLDIATLIQFHMRYYTSWKQSRKAMTKDVEALGILYEWLEILHKCDEAAH